MKEVLLSQIDEMLHIVIEAEHQGAIKITDVEMEDSSYNNEDDERYLSITVEYVPMSFLIDPEGKIVAIGLEGEELHNKLEELLK